MRELELNEVKHVSGAGFIVLDGFQSIFSGSPMGGQLGDATSVNFTKIVSSSVPKETVKSRTNDLIENCKSIGNNPKVTLSTVVTTSVAVDAGVVTTGGTKSTGVTVNCGETKEP